MSKNRMVRIDAPALVSAFLIALVFLCPPVAAPGYEGRSDRPRMADSLWLEDLDHFARELPARHKNLFFKISEEEFLSMVREVRDGIPGLDDYEIVVAMMRILAEVGDSHTMLGITVTGMMHKLPVLAEWYSDGLYVVKASPEHREILGKHILGIEGRSIDEVNRLVATVIPHDNDAQMKTDGPRYVAVPEILAALGLADDPDTVAFDVESLGEVKLAAVAFSEEISWISVLNSLGCDLPLHMQNPDQHYWFAYQEDIRLLYINYRSCREMKTRPFTAFTQEVLGVIDSRPVDKVVFDMRHNGGGSSALAGPLITAIKGRASINREGRLFVVIGRKTFSSAILNALEFMEVTGAILVGEATGGKPNHYGEVRFFSLPNSMIPVQYSTKYFSRYPKDVSTIQPDFCVEVSFEDLLACRDPVLEAILSW